MKAHGGAAAAARAGRGGGAGSPEKRHRSTVVSSGETTVLRMMALLVLLGVAGRTAFAARPFSHGWDTPKVMLWTTLHQLIEYMYCVDYKVCAARSRT